MPPKKPAVARRGGALGRQVKVTGFDLTFRPQPTITLLWALGDEETRRVIEAAHERVIAAVLAWIEDEAAILRFGAKGVYQVRPVHGLAAARFRHYEARSGMPLLFLGRFKSVSLSFFELAADQVTVHEAQRARPPSC